MMATAAVIGLSPGNRLLSSSVYYSDLTDKLVGVHEHGVREYQVSSVKNVIIAKKSSNYGPRLPSNRPPQSINALKENVDRQPQSINALKEYVDTSIVPSTVDEVWSLEEVDTDFASSLETLLLLQKSMLEKQWSLSFHQQKRTVSMPGEESCNNKQITCSGISARQRRMSTRRKSLNHISTNAIPRKKTPGSIVGPELFQRRSTGYVNGVLSEELLTHAEVVNLFKKIKAGLTLEDHKKRLQERLGYDPCDEELANSLRISRRQLQTKRIECSLAREKLAMSNVRLVMSIAQKYDNMGTEMADLVQAGLIGLLRGIEKFDSSKGFKISTYIYWWIRQGVTKALFENSRTVRLPGHLHERLSLIRNAKMRLEQQGITPTVDRIAESLNMSTKKVRNATEAINKVFSLDRDAFPSVNGLPGETHHSYIADNRLENNPWNGVDEWSLKEEVNNLISTTLGAREQDIIRLYHGLDKECLTWEDISKRIGLSRERVRQIGLVSMEKLKHEARKRRLEAMLVKH